MVLDVDCLNGESEPALIWKRLTEDSVGAKDLHPMRFRMSDKE